MSKLEELIQELCPNGVNYYALKDMTTYLKGMTGVSNKWKETGNCRFIEYMNVFKNISVDVTKFAYATVNNLNQTVLKKGDLLFTSASETINECALSSVIESDIDNGIFLDDHLFGLRIIDDFADKVDVSFLKHLFRGNEFRRKVNKTVRGATRFYISKDDFLKISIPVPPLEVQREIVQILDKFTLLTAELTAELTARKQQYEHYRDSLLSFNSEIKNLPLNDIMISIKDGSHNPPKDAGYATNLPMISAQNINNGIIDFTNVRFLTDSDFTLEHKRTNIQRNDVLLTIVGAVGRVAVVNTDKKFTCQRSVCILKPNCELIDSEYLKFILESSNIQNYFINNANGAAQKGIYLNQIKNIMIPVPSLEIQKRLVKVLNNFDKICSDLGIGLPAEIEARQQQYEYYRSKLLTMVAEVVNFKASKQASKQAR